MFSLSAALKYSGLTDAYRTPFPSLSLFLFTHRQLVFGQLWLQTPCLSLYRDLQSVARVHVSGNNTY